MLIEDTVKFRYYDHLKLRHFIYLKPYFESLSYIILHFLQPVYIWLETTFGTVQKWSLRPLLDSLKGGLNIGILLYLPDLFQHFISLCTLKFLSNLWWELTEGLTFGFPLG